MTTSPTRSVEATDIEKQRLIARLVHARADAALAEQAMASLQNEFRNAARRKADSEDRVTEILKHLGVPIDATWSISEDFDAVNYQQNGKS